MRQKFKTGDSVHHSGNGGGTVVKVDDNGTVFVEFDRTTRVGEHYVGVYGKEWFTRYPGVLKDLRRETWGEWARSRFRNLFSA